MDYCGPRGIPHSKFLKWKRTDRAKALQWLRREMTRCQSCGTPADDWNAKRGGHPQAYVPRVLMCPGCKARSGVAASLEAIAEQQRWGLSVQLTPNQMLDMWRTEDESWRYQPLTG